MMIGAIARGITPLWGYREAIASYATAISLCLLILRSVLRLRHASIAIPFDYRGGDELFYSMLVKGMLDNGWFLHNRFLGMPTALALHDFPITENFHLLSMKFMSSWIADYAVIFNLYFLLTFPFATISALFVMRRFNVSSLPAIIGSLLFTFLPYHFWRGESHFFLSAYYLTPLIVMVSLWVFMGQPLFHVGVGARTHIWGWVRPKGIASIVICVVVASGGAYFAFFAGVFLLVAGVGAFLRQRSLQRVLTTAILLAVLFLTVLMNVAPSILYTYQHGQNSVRERSPGEAEIYGAKIVQLLLPISEHRLLSLARIRDKYNRLAPLVNENDASSLGMVGSIGFVVLLGWLIYRNTEAQGTVLLNGLSVLNIAAVLLATIGGFGSLFAFLISPQMRALNRISVYIGFFSLFAVVLLLDKLGQQWSRSQIGRSLYYGVLGLTLPLGILDQTIPGFVPPYQQTKADYTSDAAFVRRIEALMPAHAMIFQLPYMRFPESPPVHRMSPYDHFRGYFHSRTLRWSFGAMRGREGDAWQAQVAAQPLSELVERLATAGFSGIYLDRYGYADQGAAIEARLSRLLELEPLVSENQRLIFFDLEQFRTYMELVRVESSGQEIGADAAPTGRWTFSNLGGKTPSRPAVAAYQGELHTLVRGVEDRLYYTRSVAGGWAPWGSIGGLTRAAPAAAAFRGKLWVFIRGTNNGVSASSMSEQRWSGWGEISEAGLTPSGPAAVVLSDALYLFVRTMTNKVFMNRLIGDHWSGWSEVPGGILTASTPGAAAFAQTLHLFIRSMDDSIHVNRFDGTHWSGWSEVPGGILTASTPGAAAFAQTLHLFIRSMDDGIHVNRFRWEALERLERDTERSDDPLCPRGGLD